MSGFIVITLFALYSILSVLRRYRVYIDANKMDITYYHVTPKAGSMVISDPENVIDQMVEHIERSKLQGETCVNIVVDLRYAHLIAIYKAIETMKTKGVKVSETKSPNPTSMLLELKWDAEYA